MQLTFSATKRDLILSIKPCFANKIMRGVKTVELRRRFSPEAPIGACVFIYASSPVRQMVGVATITDLRCLPIAEIWEQYGDKAGVTREQMESYFVGIERGYAIVLHEPRELRVVAGIDYLRREFGFRAPQSYQYAAPEYHALIG